MIRIKENFEHSYVLPITMKKLLMWTIRLIKEMSVELKSLNFCYNNEIIVNNTVNERNVCRIKRFNLLL